MPMILDKQDVLSIIIEWLLCAFWSCDNQWTLEAVCKGSMVTEGDYEQGIKQRGKEARNKRSTVYKALLIESPLPPTLPPSLPQ